MSKTAFTSKVFRFLGFFVFMLTCSPLCFSQQPTECPPECVTDSMEIVTWYPSPYNEYEELRLYPKRNDEESQCNSSEQLGLIYYNKDEQALKVCWQSPDTLAYSWEKITLGQGGYWQLSGNDIANTNSGIVQVAGFRMPTGAQTNYILMSDASGNASWQPITAANFSRSQTFTGNGTFTVPVDITQIKVEVWSGGGGGGGAGGYCCGSNPGGAGGASSFGGNLVSASGGSGSTSFPNGGAGGNSSAPVNVSGGQGGWGGYSPGGCSGTGGIGGNGAGNGGHGGCAGGNGQPSGGGGGGGAYGKAILTVTPGGSYSVIVGQGGGGGYTPEGSSGTSGGNGKVIVYY